MRALATKLCLWARPRAEEHRGCVAWKKKEPTMLRRLRLDDQALEKPAFGKRNGGVSGDDEVIEHPHIHQGECLFERLGKELIGP